MKNNSVLTDTLIQRHREVNIDGVPSVEFCDAKKCNRSVSARWKIATGLYKHYPNNRTRIITHGMQNHHEDNHSMVFIIDT